ncbi:MAG: DUF368 domain-containing protein [Planctomycetota bacterium]
MNQRTAPQQSRSHDFEATLDLLAEHLSLFDRETLPETGEATSVHAQAPVPAPTKSNAPRDIAEKKILSEPANQADKSAAQSNANPSDSDALPPLVGRSIFGGVLMGLANLVPGISGGTMLLAAGVYPKFVDAVAEVTRFKFRIRSLVVLGCVVGAALLGILLLAGPLKNLVVSYRWAMYSLFIGLTFGGVPLVWKMARPASTSLVLSGCCAFACMVVLAVLQATGVVGSGSGSTIMYFVAGLAGASAMILPGLSGGYLLLLLGQYVPILSAIETFKDALKSGDIGAALGPALTVMLPVGIGVVLGVAVVGNALQWLLKNRRQATLGALLGLLVGSTAGLWPFQDAVQPQVGDTIKGQVVTEATLAEIDEEDWNTEFFTPNLVQSSGAILLTILGFGITMGVAKIGGGED